MNRRMLFSTIICITVLTLFLLLITHVHIIQTVYADTYNGVDMYDDDPVFDYEIPEYELLDWYDLYQDFIGDRGYEFEHTDFLGDISFHTAIGAQGIQFMDCYALKNSDECVVYAGDVVANTNKIIIPETIYDAVTETNRKVVGLIAYSDHDKDWDPYDEDLEPCDIYASAVGSEWKLKEIVLPKNLRFIGRGALSGYEDLEKITFNSTGNLTIEKQAFGGCTSLKEVNFNTTGKVTVQDRAFYNCKSLEAIAFPSNSNVSVVAMQGCTGLLSIQNAPGTVDLGEFNTQDEQFRLKRISFREGEKIIGGIRCDTIAWDDDSGQSDETDKSSLTDVTIPSSAEVITGLDNTGITSISLPSGVRLIDAEAFKNCKSLTYINLPQQLIAVGYGAFENCSSLTGITELPPNVRFVLDFAFYGCRKLNMSVKHPNTELYYQYKDSGITNITLPHNVFEIYPSGLTGCPNLQSIEISGGSDNTAFMTKDGILYVGVDYDYAKDKFKSWAIAKYPAGMSNSGSYTIPDFVKGVCAFAFDDCSFTEIHIHEKLKYIMDDWMASLTEDKCYYPFSRMKTNPTLYVYRYSKAHSYFDDSYMYYDNPIKYVDGKCVADAKVAKKVKISKFRAKSKKRKITLQWAKCKNVTGYEVWYKIKGSKKWRWLSDVKSNKKTTSKLKKGKKYSFRVRSFKSINGWDFYGKWSRVKTVKCK